MRDDGLEARHQPGQGGVGLEDGKHGVDAAVEVAGGVLNDGCMLRECFMYAYIHIYICTKYGPEERNVALPEREHGDELPHGHGAALWGAGAALGELAAEVLFGESGVRSEVAGICHLYIDSDPRTCIASASL